MSLVDAVAGGSAGAPAHILTWQGHPEFDTPTGRMCLAGILDQTRQKALAAAAKVAAEPDDAAAAAKARTAAAATEADVLAHFREMSAPTDSIAIARATLAFLWRNSRRRRRR